MVDPTKTGSVTRNLHRAQTGDDRAFSWIWKRYYHKLVSRVKKCPGVQGAKACEAEDLAADALVCFHEGLKENRFHSLGGRNQLWSLLTVIATRRSKNAIRDSRRQKRSHQIDKSSLPPLSIDSCQVGKLDLNLSQLELDEAVGAWLALLDREDPKLHLRKIADLKLRGHNHSEVASIIGCARKTVAMRVSLIYQIWLEVADE
jgi:DNA-directed RNA polymerase specialized sigma24 family protein